MKQLFLLFFVSLCFNMSGTHTIQAHIEYSYIKTLPDSSNQYRIRLFYTRDCSPGAVQFPDSVSLGIYDRKTKSLIKSLKTPLSTRIIQKNCYDICLEEALYEGFVSLAANDSGFFVTHALCCRMSSVNLRNGPDGNPDQGTTVYCFIPSKYWHNSNTILSLQQIMSNPAKIDSMALQFYDAENDSVVITLAEPHQGASVNNNDPEPSPIFIPLLSIPAQNYETGFSGKLPLGINGIFKIENGKLIVRSAREGNYFVALNVDEYRNGVLVGQTIWETMVHATNTIQKYDKLGLSGWSEKGPRAILNWNYCGTDINSYVIEKSLDGNSFNPIDTVPFTQKITNDDDVNWNTIYYYRIKGIKSPSSSIYSDTALVRFWNTGLSDQNISQQITLSPVPVSGICHIHSETVDITAYTIHDHMGRKLQTITLSENLKNFDLDCTVFTAGVYFIQLQTAEGKMVNKRLVKL